MKSKAHILVVEDQSMIYIRLKRALEEEHYSVDGFTPSVEEALSRINMNRPDLILLDINLKGELNGIHLGEKLLKDYQIPFIYVTDIDDNETFYKALNSGHEDFLSKKQLHIKDINSQMIPTKPFLDPNRLIRAIQTTLKRTRDSKAPIQKEGIFGCTGYLDELKNSGKDDITKVPVKFEDIAFFSIRPFQASDGTVETLRPNYVWFQTKNPDTIYFLKTSLRELQKSLPYNFVRVNESYIINISSEFFKGRINGNYIQLMDCKITIGATFKKEFEERLDCFYK